MKLRALAVAAAARRRVAAADARAFSVLAQADAAVAATATTIVAAARPPCRARPRGATRSAPMPTSSPSRGGRPGHHSTREFAPSADGARRCNGPRRELHRDAAVAAPEPDWDGWPRQR